VKLGGHRRAQGGSAVGSGVCELRDGATSAVGGQQAVRRHRSPGAAGLRGINRHCQGALSSSVSRQRRVQPARRLPLHRAWCRGWGSQHGVGQAGARSPRQTVPKIRRREKCIRPVGCACLEPALHIKNQAAAFIGLMRRISWLALLLPAHRKRWTGSFRKVKHHLGEAAVRQARLPRAQIRRHGLPAQCRMTSFIPHRFRSVRSASRRSSR